MLARVDSVRLSAFRVVAELKDIVRKHHARLRLAGISKPRSHNRLLNHTPCNLPGDSLRLGAARLPRKPCILIWLNVESICPNSRRIRHTAHIYIRNAEIDGYVISCENLIRNYRKIDLNFNRLCNANNNNTISAFSTNAIDIAAATAAAKAINTRLCVRSSSSTNCSCAAAALACCRFQRIRATTTATACIADCIAV